MSSAPRKPAPRLARPAARYWKGKVPKGITEVDSDSDADEEEQQQEEEGDVQIGGEQDIIDQDADEDVPLHSEVPRLTKSMNIALKDVNISKEGKVIVAGREESGKTAAEDEESESEESNEDVEGDNVRLRQDSDESSEYETESEEEEKPKLQFRPVFVPKRSRVTIQEKEAIAQETEEAAKKREEELEERRKQSHNLVAESIRRELAEKEKEEEVPDVDDTDDLDPGAEFEAWRLRELGRIKKEKEAEIKREEEREEIERRRALPEAQRLKEDLERAQKLRDEKPKGQQKFLQKYWHKGAFHQDAEILKRHDFTEATESTMDVSVLPQVMQVKNFGKRSRTKYTHLVDQDTTLPSGGFGGSAPVKHGGTSMEGGGCFLCGGPHLKKDCPQNTFSRDGARSGANALPTGPRQTESWRDDRDPRKSEFNGDRRRWGKDRADDRPRYESGSGRQSSRSRSRTPPRRDYGQESQSKKERRRSRSREYSDDNGYREKRRKLASSNY